MPKKFIRCVKKVSHRQKHMPKSKQVNPYAVCRVSTGYYGSTHHIGLKHKITHDRKNVSSKRKCPRCGSHNVTHSVKYNYCNDCGFEVEL